MLRRAFPQLSAHTSFEFFFWGLHHKLELLAANTPEELQELMNCSKTNSALYVKPKEQENVSPTPDPTDSMDLEESDNEEKDDVVLVDDEEPEETEPEQPVCSTGVQATKFSLKTSRTATCKITGKHVKRALEPESDLQKRLVRKTQEPAKKKKKHQFTCNHCN